MRYLASSVFVSVSTIENSPNSVGEAMLFGCPVVSSCVGGVLDMLEHGQEGFLYQASAPYMLAWYVGCVFRDDGLENKRLRMEVDDKLNRRPRKRLGYRTSYGARCSEALHLI